MSLLLHLLMLWVVVVAVVSIDLVVVLLVLVLVLDGGDGDGVTFIVSGLFLLSVVLFMVFCGGGCISVLGIIGGGDGVVVVCLRQFWHSA